MFQIQNVKHKIFFRSYINMNTQTLIEVPKSLRAITLEQYQRYLKYLDQFREDDDMSGANMEALRIFCNLNEEAAKGIKMTQYSSIIEHISDLFDDKPHLVHRFSMEGTDGVEIQFGFIPKLEDITMGEFVDLDGYMGDWQQMHKAMAVLYRPVVFEKKERYLIEEYKGTADYGEIMKDMPVDIAMGAVVFFYRLGMRLSKHLVDSLEKQTKKGEIIPHSQTSQQNGDGINQFMRSLEELQQKLTKLQNLI